MTAAITYNPHGTGGHRVYRVPASCRPRKLYRAVAPADPPQPPPRPDYRRLGATYRMARSCLYREQCGCVYADCAWKGRKVTMQECIECLESTVLSKGPGGPLVTIPPPVVRS